MDSTTRTVIILAAVSAVGPRGDVADWDFEVAKAAVHITAMLGETSTVSRAVAQVEASTPFPATILSVEPEKSSKRALVTLRTRPSEHHPDGIEPARSERYDGPFGKDMARRLRALIGHRVIVWVEREAMSNGTRKVRVIRHVEDQGIDPNAGQAQPVAESA
jgi:hypothetical protein